MSYNKSFLLEVVYVSYLVTVMRKVTNTMLTWLPGGHRWHRAEVAQGGPAIDGLHKFKGLELC
jgi:hypothetical protein